MKLKNLFVPLLLASAVTFASYAKAQFVYPIRTSFNNITFSNADFSNANVFYKITQDAYSISGPATTTGYSPNLKSSHTGFSWTGYGGTTVSNVSEFPNLTVGDLTSTGANGGFVLSYNTAAEADFNNLGSSFGNTFIVRKSFGGLIGLEFQGGGTGLVDNNGSFTVDVLINGNWSNQGTGANQTEFIGLNPFWTIDKNFVFNGASTEFLAHANPFNGNNPALDFVLHGSAAVTPEPGALALFGSLGLTAAGLLYRRRSHLSNPRK